MIRYRLKLQPDGNGTIVVTSPDFPVVAYGEDEPSALRHAEKGIEALLASMMDARLDIPVPVIADEDTTPSVRLSLETNCKVELYLTLRAAGLTRGELQGRLEWKRESVDRLFRLDHKSKLEHLDEAFRALGKEVRVQIRDTAVSNPAIA